MVRRFFRYETYYLYEYVTRNVEKLDEANFLPKIDNFTLKIVSTNQEADELEADGLEFRSPVTNDRNRLEQGAIAFCIFVGHELAHRKWIAMSDEAKDSLNEPCFRVDFSNNEVCHGDTWTHPKYRRMGLSSYVDFNMFQFLKERGKTVHRGPIAKGNIVAQMAYAKFGPTIYAEARYLKILWWKSWKEKPLT